MTARVTTGLPHAIFLVSGACGLACQVIWTRMFGLGLGQEMPAVLAVVAAFFGGFALGAWASDNLSRRARGRPLLWYAALELVIGGWVLISGDLIPAANRLALDWIGLEPSAFRQALVAFGVPFVTLLPATMAMGATLAAMESFARGLVADGRAVGSLYAANTLGAMVGALGVLDLGFRHGFAGTLMIAGVLNLACAVAAAVLNWLPAASPSAARVIAGPAAGGSSPTTGRVRLLLFATGLFGIGLEVLGVRVLRLVLEDTIYTFACLLAVYLLGTALGAALIPRVAVRWPVVGRPGTLLMGLAATCALSGWALGLTPRLYPWLREALSPRVEGTALAESLVAVVVFLPPSLFMGATFATLAQAARDAGFGVGRALAWNTLGGALAPLVVGVVAFPSLGAKGTLAVLVVGYFLLALGFGRGWRGLWGLAPLALALGFLPDLRLIQLQPGESLRTLRQGVSDSVAVIGTADGHRTLRVNNRFTMGGTGSTTAERRQAHMPLLLHPNPRRALFLGSATGITAAAATAHPDVFVDSVELVPGIVAVMPEFAPENFAPPGRLRQYTADARRFVRTTTNRYDVIVADLFHPARDGAGALYTVEHFAAVRERLAPDGLFCQWVPLYQTDEATFEIILATFRAVFGQTTDLWLLRTSIGTPVVGLVGTNRDPAVRRHRPGGRVEFEARVGGGSLRDALKSVGLAERAQLRCLLLTPEPEQISPREPVASDDRPLVAYTGPRGAARPGAAPWETLFKLMGRCPVLGSGAGRRFINAVVADEELVSLLMARDKYLWGLRLEAEGRPAEARDAFLESARLSGDFTTGYAHVITLAVQASRDNPAEARRLLERLIELRPELPVAGQLRERLFPADSTVP